MTPLTAEQEAELKVLMTLGGYQAALQVFGEATIRLFVATRPCLLLAAADLLDGLPAGGATAPDAGDSALKRFKLDVLEFEYAPAKGAAVDYASISKNLRVRALTECKGARRVSNPAPEIQGWGLL